MTAPLALRLALLAFGYALLAGLTVRFLWLTEAQISLLWPAAGLALAAVLWGGWRCLLAIGLGAWLANLLFLGSSVWQACWDACVCMLQPWLAQALLRRLGWWPEQWLAPQQFLRLGLVAAVAVLPTSALGVAGLWLSGAVPAEGLLLSWMAWWQGDTLGIVLLTPLLLIWRERPRPDWLGPARALELTVLLGLLLLCGLVVFQGWMAQHLGWLLQNYTLFGFVIWAALRFGAHGASLTIVLVALQAALAMAEPAAAYPAHTEPLRMAEFWLYAMVLASTGMTLSLSLAQSQRAQALAQASTGQLQALTASVPGVVYQFERRAADAWRFVYMSEGVQRLFGVSAAQALQDADSLTRLIDPADQASYQASVERSAATLMPWQHECRIQTPHGQQKWVHGRALPVRQPDGSLLWSGILSDVTTQHLLQERLRLSASVFEHVQESIMITDAERRIVDVNQAFCRVSGYSRAEVLGQDPRLLASGRHGPDFYSHMWTMINTQGFWTGELWNRHKSGRHYAVLLHVAQVRDAQQQLTHYIGLSSEITDLKQRQQEIERNAHFDTLTGVPNRLLLTDRLSHAMTQARRNQRLLALCYLDLDGFKTVNDRHGHDAGDAVLQEVVQRIRHCIRADDTLARVGGDEFVLLLPGLQHPHEFAELLERLLIEIALPIVKPELGLRHRLSVSVGVSLFPELAQDAASLMQQADFAMYSAKRAGKNRWHLHGSHGQHNNKPKQSTEPAPL